MLLKLARTLDAPREIDKITRDRPPVHPGNWLEEHPNRFDCDFEHFCRNVQRRAATTNRILVGRFHGAPFDAQEDFNFLSWKYEIKRALR
jgi:hypothetical protein